MDLRKLPRRPRKRKQRVIDPIKEQETAKRIAEIEAKRQKVIDEVHQSLEKRRLDKLAIQRDYFEKEERAQQKLLRDSRKTGSEKQMLEVIRRNRDILLI